MSPDDRWRLTHMIEAAEQALEFVAGRDLADLDRDAMLRLALTRAVEIIGEAASKVSDAGRAEMTSIPWAQIIGERIRMIHAYFDINRNILWDTVHLDLPPLLGQLKSSPGSA
ncbi:MAG: DUF86 domain-containing protein [Rhodocyclaceae bacterium]|nr:DUF86 domain-containing protein [Rhodocyclaceae bacterium]MBX3667127.1 DUF86 domain-containing protein [Rhodocyclaceae bacterium]